MNNIDLLHYRLVPSLPTWIILYYVTNYKTINGNFNKTPLFTKRDINDELFNRHYKENKT